QADLVGLAQRRANSARCSRGDNRIGLRRCRGGGRRGRWGKGGEVNRSRLPFKAALTIRRRPGICPDKGGFGLRTYLRGWLIVGEGLRCVLFAFQRKLCNVFSCARTCMSRLVAGQHSERREIGVNRASALGV